MSNDKTGAAGELDPRARIRAIERAALRILAGLFAGIALSAALAVCDYVVGAVVGAVLAALLAGATLGFLFGIPRALAMPATGAGAQPPTAAGGGFGHNTNLEQISDWLTKIVVGIGLVEAQRIGTEFQALSRQVALEWGLGANGPASAGMILLAALLFGFIGFYIWTRTAFVYYLEYNETAVAAERRERELAEHRARQAEDEARTAAEAAAQSERSAAEERARKAEAERLAAQAEQEAQQAREQAQQAQEQAQQAHEQVQQAQEQVEQANSQAKEMSLAAGFLQTGTVVPLQTTVRPPVSASSTRDFWTRIVKDYKQHKQDLAGAEAAADQKDLWNSDPNLGAFGGQAQAGGRELSAQVQPLNEAGQTCAVTIRVRSLDAARPLQAPVMIHLHPTFRPSEREAVLSGGTAELRIIASGVFTVGAETDDGVTRLELNLADLPGLPPAFAAN